MGCGARSSFRRVSHVLYGSRLPHTVSGLVWSELKELLVAIFESNAITSDPLRHRSDHTPLLANRLGQRH